MLWACLLLPSLPLDVFARALSPADSAQPFAVTTGGHYPRIVVANVAARDAGVAAEQLVSASLALAPDHRAARPRSAAETAALDGVAMWATQFTPMVSVARPDAVLAEIGGSLRLFGGRADWRPASLPARTISATRRGSRLRPHPPRHCCSRARTAT